MAYGPFVVLQFAFTGCVRFALGVASSRHGQDGSREAASSSLVSALCRIYIARQLPPGKRSSKWQHPPRVQESRFRSCTLRQRVKDVTAAIWMVVHGEAAGCLTWECPGVRGRARKTCA